ncbi:contact-dependent growth inhibition system immunity protein [Nocardia sp. NPDC003482]
MAGAGGRRDAPDEDGAQAQADLFSAEYLRILLGQNEVTAVLLPLVLTVLERNPLAEGDYYPGDLLTTTVRIPAEMWKAGAKAPVRLHAVIDSLLRRNDLEIYFPQDDEIWGNIENLKDAGVCRILMPKRNDSRPQGLA